MKIDYTYIKRFLRTAIPQLVIIIPVLISRGQEFEKYLPIWVIPTLILIGSIVTALDKYFRDTGTYDDVKKILINN